MSTKDKQTKAGHRILKLSELDHTVKLKRKEYEKQLYQLQVDLVRLQRLVVDAKMRVVLVFEGMDAAGKGGAIKRLVQFLDPRGVEVHPTGAPNYQELLHHYMRRFWQRLPARGRIAIFDRSWYGRMLVEPIEKLCSPEEYQRAAREICEFERTLADANYCIVKFWLHIDKNEQLKRFKARNEDPLKKWKITKDDWRNRKKFDQYVEYADRMFAATDTDYAPWHLVAGNDKRHARITVAKTVVSVLDAFPTA